MYISNSETPLPDYYPTMFMDGYTPEQILMALRQKIIAEQEPSTLDLIKEVINEDQGKKK